MSDLNDEQRKNAAERILHDPLYNEAWETIAQDIMLTWQNTQEDDVKPRERQWTMLQLLFRLKGHFDQVIMTGKMQEKL